MRINALTQEWKVIFQNRKMLVSMIGIMFIPVLYGGILLWAFWDPYGNLEQLPVAVVNEDQSAELEGEEVHVGDELVRKLEKGQAFDWHFVSEEEAQVGMDQHEFYFAVYIPKHFSNNVVTFDEEPQAAPINYKLNTDYNFPSGQIGKTAVNEIQEELEQRITESYVEVVEEQFGDLTTALREVSEGSGQITDGTDELEGNLAQLNEALQQMSTIFWQAREEVGVRVDNAQQVIITLQESVLDVHTEELQQQIESAQDSLQVWEESVQDRDLFDVDVNVEMVEETLDSLEELQTWVFDVEQEWEDNFSTVKGLVAMVETMEVEDAFIEEQASLVVEQMNELRYYLEEEYEDVAQDKQVIEYIVEVEQTAQKMKDTVEEREFQWDEIFTGLQSLHHMFDQDFDSWYEVGDDIQSVARKMEDLEQSLSEWEHIHKTLKSMQELPGEAEEKLTAVEGYLETAIELQQKLEQAHEWLDVLETVEDRSVQLAQKVDQMYDGAQEIHAGAESLNESSVELTTALSTLYETIHDIDMDDDVQEMFISPVSVNEEGEQNASGTYGEGLTPYFFSLALYVGAITLSVIYPFRESLVIPDDGVDWFLGKIGVSIVMSFIQASIAIIALLYGVGVEPEKVGGFIFFSFMTALTFMIFVQFLVTLLGDPGRFIAIIILILQLSSSAGTFPLELVPQPLQLLHTWLPMTYSVLGLKSVTTLGDLSLMWDNLFVLLIFMAATLVGLAVYFIIKHDKHPAKEATE